MIKAKIFFKIFSIFNIFLLYCSMPTHFREILDPDPGVISMGPDPTLEKKPDPQPWG